ncbi:unnamed protein product [Rotaria sordida]|uniref:Tetraspanin n=1 Tax=Rotaria sordida TaxID=392033 RepID=A0A819C979_9BILA|nr:unnamed protein product [Rotaria sordida]
MQTEMNSMSKAISGENHDSYVLPIESGKAIALTMNFPQHHSSMSKMTATENNQIQNQFSNVHSHCNHITTDPHGCLDCISTMFGPNYAPFAAFMREFSEFAQTQKTIAMKQNDLIENLLSYHQQQSIERPTLNEQEFQHVFTYGTWSNGKRLFSSNAQLFMSNRWCLVLTFICTTFFLLVLGITLIILSIYLATFRDVTDPVLAFIRAYSRIYEDEFQYFKIILGLIAVGVLYIIAVIAYFSSLIGHSAIVNMIALIFNLLGLFCSVILMCIVLFMGDRMKPNFSIVLELNVENFESDTSTNSLSYSWTLMHRKYHCCVDGVLQTGLTVAQKSLIFASLYPGWSIPESCCFSDETICVHTPTVNNSFINSSCIEPASKHFNQLLSTFNFILLPIIFIAMISNICGIIYAMNLKTAIHRMNLNNNELAKSLFALKSRQLAGIHSDMKKNPIEEFQQRKNDQNKNKKQHLHIPGYFPITPTILQVRQPEQNTYLHYGL